MSSSLTDGSHNLHFDLLAPPVIIGSMNPERPLKIAFSGTLSVGKSTLLDAFRELPDVAVVEEVARPYFEANPHIIDRGAFDVQKTIIETIMENEERAMEEGKSLVVCDRSVIDGICYAKIYNDFDGAQRLMEVARGHLPSYNALYLLDYKGIRLKRDPIRTESPKFRRDLHKIFTNTFMEENISYTLLAGSREERFKMVNDHIQSLRSRTLL